MTSVVTARAECGTESRLSDSMRFGHAPMGSDQIATGDK
jgi:hypothetical protein